MRTSSERIWDLWEIGGPFVGDDKPRTVVTVEDDWWLNVNQGTTIGTWNRGPARWWQLEDNSQAETVIPNITNVNIDRSIDNQAATCTIQMLNQKVERGVVELIDQLGQPGFYTFSRGQSYDAVARWNHDTNDWEDVIVANAMLRTYQGYGPHDKDLADAIADGDLLLTGVWLVDDVDLASNGIIDIKCRDTGKLLLDQQMYPPLVPAKHYPLHYCRWEYVNRSIDNSEKFRTEGSSGGASASYGTCTNLGSVNSGSDAWYGHNASVHGHRPTHAFDGNPSTYWLSVGNSQPNAPYAVEWLEACFGGQDVSEITIHPWGGNYQVYVSVWEGGGWVNPGNGNIPYNPSGVGIYTGANAASIPFVTQAGCGWETPTTIQLPRVYQAQKVRVTLTNLQHSPHGPYHYRAGIRSLSAGFNTTKQVNVTPLSFGAAAYPRGIPNSEGYYIVRYDGDVSVFGDARKLPASSSPSHTAQVTDICPTPDGEGYYTIDLDGRIVSYGDAVHHGDPKTAGYGHNSMIGIAVTHTGDGYWCVDKGGRVYAYGDATPHSDHSGQCLGIAAHPSSMGYWTAGMFGGVDAHGTAVDHGGPTAGQVAQHQGEAASDIEPTESGNGYWITTGSGHIFEYGDAQDFGFNSFNHEDYFGTADPFGDLIWSIIPTNGDDGLAIVTARGELVTFGDFDYYGSIAEGNATLRVDGNYQDYADIIKDILLWAGWYLKDAEVDDEDVPVHGNIETTGTYSEECLPDEMFDKTPPITAITELKEAVGYIFYLDEEGAAHFRTPNWWAPGNFDEEGNETGYLPEIDESIQLTDYSAKSSDKSARSEIIISNVEPTEDFDDTITTRYKPASAEILRGMVKPAMWINGIFQNEEEQLIMAELIALHIWFAMRTGSVSCFANPAIQIDDQVRVWERTTGETYIHYVRGVSTQHNLETGEYTMTLETHWLGDSDEWALTGLGTGTLEN